MYQSGSGLGALVGVGTPNPTSNLQVYGTPIAAGNVFSVLNTAASGNVAQFSSSAGTALIINSIGNVGIGTTNPTSNLQVVGNVLSGNVISSVAMYGVLAGANTIAASSLTLTNALGTTYGGTGLTSFTSGGLLYASSTSALASSGAYTAGQILYGGGAGAAPASSSSLFWDSVNSRLGIGTASPSAPLNVWGSGPYSGLTTNPQPGQLIINTTTGSERLILGAWYTGGTGSICSIQASDYYSSADHGQALVLNPLGGNVGIGTAGAGAKLDVWTGTARSGTAPASYGAIYATADGGGGITYPPIAEFRHSNQTQGIGINFNSIFATGSNANQPVLIYSKGASEVQVVGSGVGGSGYGNLLVDYPNAGSTGGCITIRNSAGGVSAFSSLIFEVDGSTSCATTSAAPISFNQANGMLYCQNVGTAYGGSSAGKMGLQLWSGGTEFESQTWLPNGNVGIGITNPGSALEVNGVMRFTGTSTSLPGINLPTGGAGIHWGNGYSRILDDGDLRICTDDNMHFYNGCNASSLGTERITMLASGFVGIGTTSPQASLDVRNSALIGDYGGSGFYNPNAALHIRRSGVNPHLIFENIGVSTGALAGISGGMVYGCDGSTHAFRTGCSSGGDMSSTGTERMRINTTGVGIGTASPARKLHVYDASTSGAGPFVVDQFATSGFTDCVTLFRSAQAASSSWGACFMQASSGGNTIFYVRGDGYVWAANDITAFSDERVKTNLQKIEGALDKVSNINGYTFTRTDYTSEDDKDKRHVGVIAQEVQKVLPELVHEDDKGMLSVAYGNMTALLIEAIKEERQKREALEERIKLLEQK